MPKFKLLYFKNLLDVAFNKFFEVYNDKFINVNGKYVLSTSVSRLKLTYEFRKTIVQALKELITSYDILHPTYYIIIGSCMPKDNMLLNIKSNHYFPEKLKKLINSEYQIKYVLKEKDIAIDIVAFNQICIDVFDEFFAKNSVVKFFGKNCKNVIFLTHTQLDCYMLFKTLTSIYGKSNCINMHKESLRDIKSPIIAINELIDKYIHNKHELNDMTEFKNAVNEIQIYLKTKLMI